MALKMSDILLLAAAGFGVIEYTKPGHGVLGGLLRGSAIGAPSPGGGSILPGGGVAPVMPPVVSPPPPQPATCGPIAGYRYVAPYSTGFIVVWKGVQQGGIFASQSAAEQAYNALWASQGCV